MTDEIGRKISGPAGAKADREKAGGAEPPAPRKREEIAALKEKWLAADDKWQLEQTKGFQAHRTELTAFRQDWEEKQARAGEESGPDDEWDGGAPKMCPIGMLQGRGFCECAESQCAWWNEPAGACAMASAFQAAKQGKS